MTIEKYVKNPAGVTGLLVNWAYGLKISDVPNHAQHRAKLITLDGIGCGFIGAHLPWSKRATKAISELEAPGPCSLLGWQKQLSSPAAALLNSTFIQGFELDDWHPKAPLHSASLILPALLAATEHVQATENRVISGEAFLLAAIVGMELGPRIGLGLGGAELLTRGWHSGAVFGGPAVAIAVSKLLCLSPRQTEWALGTSCTQAGGLMAAQYGSMTKRMQHGFAARNGLIAAMLARADYTGIEEVLERQYGGFFSTFTGYPQPRRATAMESVTAGLGSEWEINDISIKPYPLVAFVHASVDCVRLLQERYNGRFNTLEKISEITIELGDPAYNHGGWKVEGDSLEPTGAQMSAAYAVALQLVDRKIEPMSFSPEELNRETLFKLIRMTECVHQKSFDNSLKTRVTIRFQDGTGLTETVDTPRGVHPQLSTQEILDKWVRGAGQLLEPQRRDIIERSVMQLETLDSVDELLNQLGGEAGSMLH
ncbi:MAG: hypothetical protein Q9225_004281 [Loekoesia sp. 1 TL-2023]